jgi:hypothetical protein
VLCKQEKFEMAAEPPSLVKAADSIKKLQSSLPPYEELIAPY